MQEVEAKRKLTPADGAHVFYTATFLVGSYIVKSNYATDCGKADLGLFVDFLFYGLLIWATFLVVSLIPRYKNENLRLFFNLLDLVYGLFHVALVIYTAVLFNSKDASDCSRLAPQAHLLANVYIIITGFTAAVVILGFSLWVFRRFVKPSDMTGFANQYDV